MHRVTRVTMIAASCLAALFTTLAEFLWVLVYRHPPGDPGGGIAFAFVLNALLLGLSVSVAAELVALAPSPGVRRHTWKGVFVQVAAIAGGLAAYQYVGARPWLHAWYVGVVSLGVVLVGAVVTLFGAASSRANT